MYVYADRRSVIPWSYLRLRMITNAELAEGGNDLTTITSDTNINFSFLSLNIGFLNYFVASDASRFFQNLEVRKKSIDFAKSR